LLCWRVRGRSSVRAALKKAAKEGELISPSPLAAVGAALSTQLEEQREAYVLARDKVALNLARTLTRTLTRTLILTQPWS
jgi:cobalamin biosynthesis protein CobD/CbiB